LRGRFSIVHAVRVEALAGAPCRRHWLRGRFSIVHAVRVEALAGAPCLSTDATGILVQQQGREPWTKTRRKLRARRPHGNRCGRLRVRRHGPPPRERAPLPRSTTTCGRRVADSGQRTAGSGRQTVGRIRLALRVWATPRRNPSISSTCNHHACPQGGHVSPGVADGRQPTVSGPPTAFGQLRAGTQRSQALATTMHVPWGRS
jgi:hypothetical protein